jgi:endonuclease/exonuclease/phosphatase family metal-dependent hydrolase
LHKKRLTALTFISAYQLFMERPKKLSIASCNIEGDKNIKNVREFLGTYSPDVVCFQEALEDNMTDLAKMFNYGLAFTGCSVLSKDIFDNLSCDRVSGLAILSRFPLTDFRSYTYAGNSDSIPIYQKGNPNSSSRKLAFVSIADEYNIATTHFTWAPNGGVNNEQLRDISILIDKAKLIGECVLVGDFNAPRPNTIYQVLTTLFKDAIPEKYSSSLDPDLKNK